MITRSQINQQLFIYIIIFGIILLIFYLFIHFTTKSDIIDNYEVLSLENCLICSNQLEPNDLFCSNCGESIPWTIQKKENY